MRKALLVVNAVAGSALLTLIVAVLTLLFLMFSTTEPNVRKEALFGSLFFETSQRPSGATGATMGVDNPVGLIVLFVVFAIALAMIQLVYQRLKRYRARLIQERSNS